MNLPNQRRQLHALGCTIALTIFGACEMNPPVQPSTPDEKIARIMADLSVADAATSGLSGYTKDSLMHVYFKQVFEIHGVTLEVYENDLRVLAKDLSRMESIVKQADEMLTEKKPDTQNTPKQ